MQPNYTPQRRLPHTPSRRTTQTRRAARRGCIGNLGLIVFLAFMLPVFLCGMGFVIYLVFPPAPLDVLVLGLDSRPGEGYAARTDSIMIVGLQPARLRVSMLSIPRDLFIDVPGYGEQRINTVNVLGEIDVPGSGPTLLGQGIQSSFGIQPDRYVRMNFQGFTGLIDAVGGVTIDVDRTILDDAYPTEDGGTISIRFDPGVQHMDGARALIYARTRHSDDDYQRAARQQQVLSALSFKLLNPLTWPAVMDTLNRSVDTDLSAWDMVSYAPTVILNAGRFERQVIDRDYIITTGEGVAVPNYAALDSWTRERFD